MGDVEVRWSSFDDAIAAEKGRRMAAHAIASDPHKRQEVENAFGVEYCKMRYPEAYSPGFAKSLDTARLPWD